MEIVPFAGWSRNARLVSGDTEMIVTLEVGPRILFYGFTGGANEMAVHSKDAGKIGDTPYHTYGGHRLWIAPEDADRTLQPDNDPVDVREEDGWTIFSSKTDKYHLRKEIAILPQPESRSFVLSHRIYNEGAYMVEVAPWALTQMATGGKCHFPTGPFIRHSDRVLPTRPVAMWGYTDFSDPRWTLGSRLWTLTQTDTTQPQKAGMMIEEGWAAYANGDRLFLKRFPYYEGEDYPDFGVNFETFTRHDMLEVESLGPNVFLDRGEAVEHVETWYLYREPSPPAGEAELLSHLQGLVERSPLWENPEVAA